MPIENQRRKCTLECLPILYSGLTTLNYTISPAKYMLCAQECIQTIINSLQMVLIMVKRLDVFLAAEILIKLK